MIRALRSHIRDLVGNLLLATGTTRAERRLRGQLSIATFHRVLPQAARAHYPLPGLVVTPEELRWFLEFFARSFECGTLRDASRRWRRDPDAERPSLAITFDDGQLDNWCHARPVLDDLGLKASFFVPVDAIESGDPLWHDRIAWAVGRAFAAQPEAAEALAREFESQALGAVLDPHAVVVRAKDLPPAERLDCVARWERLAGQAEKRDWDGFMDWTQLRRLSEAGHEIGSHSMSHAILPRCTDDEIEREIRESRRVIESRLDLEIESFCYPNGDWDARCVRSVEQAGYRQAVTTRWGSNANMDAPFVLRRFDMRDDHARNVRGDLSAARVAWRISGLHPGLA